MKQIILIILLSIPFLTVAQEKLEINILFGNYLNDHKSHKFHITERKWALKNNVLIYSSEANNKIYSDTTTLNNTEIQSIINFVKENKLNKSITKDLKKDNLKTERKITIKGNITLQENTFKYQITSNNSINLNEDLDVKKRKKLEELLLALRVKNK